MIRMLLTKGADVWVLHAVANLAAAADAAAGASSAVGLCGCSSKRQIVERVVEALRYCEHMGWWGMEVLRPLVAPPVS
jgi:hypothetical protein